MTLTGRICSNGGGPLPERMPDFYEEVYFLGHMRYAWRVKRSLRPVDIMRIGKGLAWPWTRFLGFVQFFAVRDDVDEGSDGKLREALVEKTNWGSAHEGLGGKLWGNTTFWEQEHERWQKEVKNSGR